MREPVGFATLLSLLILPSGCVVPVRFSAGPTLGTHARVGVEVRAGVGIGPGTSRGGVYEELFGGGGFARQPVGGFGTFGGGIGGHWLSERRKFGLRGDLHYLERVTVNPHGGFHGPGASIGVQV